MKQADGSAPKMKKSEAQREARRRWGSNGIAWARQTAVHGFYQCCVGVRQEGGGALVRGLAPDWQGYEAAFRDADRRATQRSESAKNEG